MPKENYRLKSKHVAHLLDCSPDDVIDLARNGKLKGVKEGRYWFFQFNDVETYKKKLKKKNVRQGSA